MRVDSQANRGLNAIRGVRNRALERKGTLEELYRPFRAMFPSYSFPQGVALGWFVRPLRGRFNTRNANFCALQMEHLHQQPRALPWADLLRPFGASVS